MLLLLRFLLRRQWQQFLVARLSEEAVGAEVADAEDEDAVDKDAEDEDVVGVGVGVVVRGDGWLVKVLLVCLQACHLVCQPQTRLYQAARLRQTRLQLGVGLEVEAVLVVGAGFLGVQLALVRLDRAGTAPGQTLSTLRTLISIPST